MKPTGRASCKPSVTSPTAPSPGSCLSMPCSTTRWNLNSAGTTKTGRAIARGRADRGRNRHRRFDDAAYLIEDGILDLSVSRQDRQGGHRPVQRSGPQCRADHGRSGGRTDLPTRQRNRRHHRGQRGHGLGVLSVKAKVAKSKGQERAKVDILVGPTGGERQRDCRLRSNGDANKRLIAEFLASWVHEPWCLHGVEDGAARSISIGSSRRQRDLRASRDILEEIAAVEAEMARLESDIAADIARPETMTSVAGR